MYQTWKLRLLLSGILLGAAAYALVPTFIYFSLSEEQLKEVRRDKDAFSKYLPKWSISNHIVPGLDLQGGMHMVLGVDVDKALADKTSRTADRLRQFATDKKAAFTKIEQTPDNSGLETRILVSFASLNDLNYFNKNILDQFGELVTVSESDNSLTLQLDPRLVQSTRRDAVDQTIITIRNRVDKMGVTEPSISKRGDDQIQIQLPGYDNPDEAKSLIGRTAQLEFQMCDDTTLFLTELKDLPKDVEIVTSSYGRPDGTSGKDIFLAFNENKLGEVKAFLKSKVSPVHVIKYGKSGNAGLGPVMMRTYTLHKKVVLAGDDLVNTSVNMGSETDPRPGVSITFSATGARIFDELTAANIGNRMAIVLEDLVDSAPVFQTRISGGSANISMGGGRTREESIKDANQLSLVLKSGALPAPVTFREERSVGPSLGADSVKSGERAFLAGSILVILLMIFYYRLSGFFSVVAVLMNLVFMLAALALLGATITLPGIAGLLLTFGMAVDANVIINERIREELRRGKMPRSAVKTGYAAAFSAVIDSHVTTFIAGMVLWQYGTGPVQNFATMLLIGTVLSIFTAVFITRIFFDMITAKDPKELSI